MTCSQWPGNNSSVIMYNAKSNHITATHEATSVSHHVFKIKHIDSTEMRPDACAQRRVVHIKLPSGRILQFQRQA